MFEFVINQLKQDKNINNEFKNILTTTTTTKHKNKIKKGVKKEMTENATHKAKLNGLIIQRLVIERKTANDKRQKEIKSELDKRYAQPHIYL